MSGGDERDRQLAVEGNERAGDSGWIPETASGGAR